MNARTGWPLYGKILAWLFLNAVALAIVLALVLRAGFGIDLGATFSATARGQLDSVGRLLVSELRRVPPPKWNTVLDRYDEAYGVTFLLFDLRGKPLAGPSIVLPPTILQKLTQRGSGRPRDRGENEPVLKADGSFWLTKRLPPPRRDDRRPVALDWMVVRSESMSAGGLFVDFRPWVIGLSVAVGFSILWWLPFVRRITGAVSAMRSATAQVARGDFELGDPGTASSAKKLGTPFLRATRRRDELGSLARSIREMALRLHGFVTGQRRFLGDIAHGLCAPIARAQVALGILESRVADDDRRRVDDLREEIEDMAKLVNELLSFTKASLDANPAKLTDVEVRAVIETAVRREGAGADVEIRVPNSLSARADADLLGRATGNLVRNAVRYAGSAGPIIITGLARSGWITISCEDSGPGVPGSAVDKLFDPFYRVDESRTRDSGGVGLGLAIVKNAIETCGGSVRCWNRQPTGFAVEMSLPGSSTKSLPRREPPTAT